MAAIYMSSVGNLIFLGDDDGTVEAALRNLREVLQDMRSRTNDLENMYEMTRDSIGDWKTSDTPLPVLLDEPALLNFFSRPWFKYVILSVTSSTFAHFTTGDCGFYKRQHWPQSTLAFVEVSHSIC